MDERIKPRLVDKRPVCDVDCPLYTMERHEQEASNGGIDCNDEGGLCEPYYRARVAELEAEVERLRECLRIAGLQSFMRDRPPEEVAEHLRRVMASHVKAADKAESTLATVREMCNQHERWIFRARDEFQGLSDWRFGAWGYDDDMGQERRTFNDEEEWDSMERFCGHLWTEFLEYLDGLPPLDEEGGE